MIESTGGDLTVSGPVEYYGQFQVSGGDELRFNDVVTGPRKFFGPGTVNCDWNMAPGTNPALVAFEGDVVFGTNSTHFIELAGNGGVAGTDFDQLLVSSTTTLGGDLEINLLGDFFARASNRNPADAGHGGDTYRQPDGCAKTQLCVRHAKIPPVET